MYKQAKLKNGTKVVFVPVDGTRAVTVLALCKVGSRYETKNLNGASHFIEHLMFKGTGRRPTTLDISQELDSIGAEFNAATSKDWTGYYIKASSAHVEKALDMISDMLWNSKFEKEEFDREKGVIIEEINMYEDSPMYYIEELLEQTMFKGSTLGWQIAGTKPVIKKMKRQELIDYRDLFYRPKNMVLVVAGKFEKIKPLAEKYFGSLKPKTGKKPSEYKEFSGFKKSARPNCGLMYKKTEQVHLAIGFPGLKYDAKEMPALQLMHVIFGGTMSSRLFIAIREREGLAYYVRSSVDAYADTGMFSVRAGLDISRLDKAVSILKTEIERFKKEGPTAQELKRAKEYMKGKLALALEDSFNLAEFYGKQTLLYKDVKTPKQKLSEIMAVDTDEIKKLANTILDWKKSSVAAIGPYKNKSGILKYF